MGHPLSCVPSLHGRYPLRRYYGRSDSRRAVLRATSFFGHERRSAPAGLPDYRGRTSVHSVSNHRRDDRGLPGCPAIGLAPIARFTGFAARSQARPSTPTESSSRWPPRWAACVTDWSFSLRCSPPRVATTQLRFDTARLFPARERTLTALSPRLLRRTSTSAPDVAERALAFRIGSRDTSKAFGQVWRARGFPRGRGKLRPRRARSHPTSEFGLNYLPDNHLPDSLSCAAHEQTAIDPRLARCRTERSRTQ